MSGDKCSGLPSASLRSGSVNAGVIGPPPEGYQPLRDLVSPPAVAVAAFLAGPGAAVWFLARNFRRLGATGAMWLTIALGVVVCVAVGAIAVAVPDRVPAPAFSIPLVGLAWVIAQTTQGRAFEDHVARLGPRTTGGRMVLLGLAALGIQIVVAVGAIVGYVVLTEDPKIDLGGGHEVYYRDGASADDARRVGAHLKVDGFFTEGRDASATVQRPRGRIAVGLVVNQAARVGVYDDDFRVLARSLSAEVFDGAPVDVWLHDTELEVHRRLPWTPPPE